MFLQKVMIFFKLNWFKNKLKKIYLPFLGKISLYQLINIYLSGLLKGALQQRAAAISWSLFMSVFPFILFVFRLLPHMPHYKIIENYFFNILLIRILPESIVEQVSTYIYSIVSDKDNSLLNVSLLLTIFFSTNGIRSLMNGFGKSVNLNTYKKRSTVGQYFASLVLTIFFTILILLGLLLIYYSQVVWRYIEETGGFTQSQSFVLIFVNYISTFIFYFFGVSMLYYFGLSIKRGVQWVFTGAFLSTVLFFGTLFLFSYYIENFTKYNILYGSVGTIIIVMLWIYVNVIIILLGFELNAAIGYFRKDK